jgi:mRNA degradation ribonuclease J1/J2
MAEPDELLAKAAEAVRKAIADYGRESSDETIQVTIRRVVRKIVKAQTGRRPVVLPVVMEL